MTETYTVFRGEGYYSKEAASLGEFLAIAHEFYSGWDRAPEVIAWMVGASCETGFQQHLEESLRAGRFIDLRPDGCGFVALGNPLEEKKRPESLGAILRRAQESLTASATPTLDKLENERDPQRPPLPYFTEKPADRWAGYVTKTSTTEQPRQSFLCDSPDLLPASHQLSPHFGSASLKG